MPITGNDKNETLEKAIASHPVMPSMSDNAIVCMKSTKFLRGPVSLKFEYSITTNSNSKWQ